MNRISALIKRTSELSLPPCHTEIHEKTAICNPEEGPCQHPTMLAPDLRLPASRTMKNKRLSAQSRSLLYSLTTE